MPGQRWVSDSEPELGLGIVLRGEFGRVEIFFPAANEHRQYALESAPLRRVRFASGDRIRTHAGDECLVDAVAERAGLLVYRAGEREIAEAELSDSISFSKPGDRLLGGQVDDLRAFDLRVEALAVRSRMRQSPVRGFAGGRMDLIPHQISIAAEVASRLRPRVLLADEVGLGKTIEACLILHRLHLTGRADRVLILVPEPLVHQWFVELLRRFNLLFSIFDEERCAAIEAGDADANPFLDSQLVLCGVDFLAASAGRARQALDAGWDLLIVDEAHHLEWSAGRPGARYALVESLAASVAGLLLLTATPQQLGPEGHFARLRLLDPDRYRDLDRFLEESSHYEEVARAIDRVLAGKPLTKRDAAAFEKKSGGVRALAAALDAGDASARSKLVEALLDEFGTGRVMFRNTRATVAGFPKRRARLAPIEGETGDAGLAARVRWLAGLLGALGGEKTLVIGRTRELAEEIHARLQREVRVSAALFHEGLSLMQRDRNAAFFAEEDGARVLICSEIGSEGRNFQFAHHLVLIDLPGDPELLEQRIGRLDRIGQTSTITIHVPWVAGTESEVLARWYHEGLNAIEENLHGASEILREFRGALSRLGESFDAGALAALIERSKESRATVTRKLARGHDRLLELNSCKPGAATACITRIRAHDADEEFEGFLLRLLDHFGVHIEELGRRSYLIQPGHLTTGAFPALPDDGLSVTFDRARALSREDLAFVTIDHPLARGALDLLLGAESGNAAFGVWRAPGRETLILEVHAVVECIAPAALHADRFLPATPIRVAVDHSLGDMTANRELASAKLEKGDVFRVLDTAAIKRKFLPAMLDRAAAIARERMGELVDAACADADARLRAEITRLEDLRAINDHVSPDEIAALEAERAALDRVLRDARIRIDALRLVLRQPAAG